MGHKPICQSPINATLFDQNVHNELPHAVNGSGQNLDLPKVTDVLTHALNRICYPDALDSRYLADCRTRQLAIELFNRSLLMYLFAFPQFVCFSVVVTTSVPVAAHALALL